MFLDFARNYKMLLGKQKQISLSSRHNVNGIEISFRMIGIIMPENVV